MQLESFDGVRLHYDVEGTGPPVVLLHGFASDTDQNWRAPGVMKALTVAGHQVIGLDARGHGRSQKCHEPEAYENDAMAKDVITLFDALGLQDADVAGYSMGSGTALRLAQLDGRIRRLVLGGAGIGVVERLRGGDVRSGRAARIAQALETADPSTIEDPLAKGFRRFAERTGADRKALVAIQRSRRFMAFGELSEIKVPTLVICGDEDFDPHPLAEALPAAWAEIVSGDHLTAVSDPAFAAKIVEFLGSESVAA
jgi:pimeloyl-ACP methyl ester carboxylesterase